MGIQDRDYYREGSSGFLDAWGRQGAVVWLVIITSVIFFAQCLTGGPTQSELFQVGAYSLQGVRAGEVWRLITPLFLHASLWHLFFNMLVLYWAGSRIEELYGSREFVLFYFMAGLFSQGIFLLSQVAGFTNAFATAIGASGAATAVLMLFAIHYPHQKVLLYFVIPVPVWLLVILFIARDLWGAMGLGATGIGYFAHLGGALFGFLYYRSGVRFSRLFVRLPSRVDSRKARPTLRLLPMEQEEEKAEPVGAAVESAPRPKEAHDEHLEAKLDRVLEKLSIHGQESLTAEEREILVKASEVYKKRRK